MSVFRSAASRSVSSVALLVLCSLTVAPALGGENGPPSAKETARQVDEILTREAAEAGVELAGNVSDDDFLRRVSLDLTGQLPRASRVTLFRLSPNEDKRSELIDQLLDEPGYAANWTNYWRDVIYRRATNMRAPISLRAFEGWMGEQLDSNRPWDEVVSELITATGHVQENGATGLIFAHEGQPEEIAAEVSRIFLGIQIQCANCHDHPWDEWKRDQFHELTAYFPRVRLRRERVDGKQVAEWYVESKDFERSRRRRPSEFLLRRIDRNRDGVLSKAEFARLPRANQNFDRLLGFADSNGDGRLSIEELLKAEPPTNARPGQGSLEHYMPDLSDPGSKGTRVDPAFFAVKSRTRPELDDQDRRNALARLLTSKRNPWFAKAFVNRMWAQLLGEGFYMPIDDMGPGRSAQSEEALQVLCEGFLANNYDVKWLLRTITNTAAYQRQLRTTEDRTEGDTFAATSALRLRGDQVFDAIMSVLGGPGAGGRRMRGGAMMSGYGGRRSPRSQMNALFGFDPSTPQEDLTGSIPQALFMMNSPQLANATKATGFTKLAGILRSESDDTQALTQVYVLVLGRDPSTQELKICQEHIAAADSREAGFEDVMWSLLNSAEFLSRR